MTRKLFTLFGLLIITLATVAQAADSLQTDLADSTQTVLYVPLDSQTIQSYNTYSNQHSFLIDGNKPWENNIQQYNRMHNSGVALAILMVLLGVLTYIKVFFGSELQDIVYSVFNRNLSMQLFRTQSGEITFSSFLLHVNFLVAVSLYLQFYLEKYFPVTSSNQFVTLIILIFLFTFFYLIKIVLMNLIGVVFELKEECSLYVYDFTTLCKTLGLTLIPALFVFYTAPKIFYNFIFLMSALIAGSFILIFVFRGLSTATKLMYRSVYHFFIYVCVVEISTVFLFFKLLTKTII
ncbi:MAG: DUF4271 domain-containing protein [Chitinophagales bacterium]